MTTNEQIITRIDTMENNMNEHFKRVEDDVDKNKEKIEELDTDLRGNGSPGIKARLASVEKYIADTKKWQMAIFMIVLADIVTRVLAPIWAK